MEVGFYDGVANTQGLVIDEDENEQDFREISFEKSENKFILEDFFYKYDYKLPKKVSDINWIKELPEFEELIQKIEKAIKSVREIKNTSINTFNRIDGILLKKPSKQLILLTEFHLIDFILKNDEYELVRSVDIATIDYITLGRSGNFLILHLVPIYKNKENINKNYYLSFNKLEKVVCCITSSSFYDKPEGSTIKFENINRQISVITINDNFEINENLQKISNFTDYRNSLTDFLEQKISECKLPGCLEDDLCLKFKYASVKYRLKDKNNDDKDINKQKVDSHYKNNFIIGDLIITKSALYLLDYNRHKKRFEILYDIKINELTKLTVNRNVTNCFIIYDKSSVLNGLEIMSESCKSLLALIDEIYQMYTPKVIKK